MAQARGSTAVAAASGVCVRTGPRRLGVRHVLAALAVGLAALGLAGLFGSERAAAPPAAPAEACALAGSAFAAAPGSSGFEERRLRDAYGGLPLAFTADAGRGAGRVRYVAR